MGHASDVVGGVRCLGLGRVKLPNTVCLVGLKRTARNLVDHGVETWAVRHTVEESSLPLGTLLLFSLAQLALLVLDERLLGRCGVHITTVDGIGNLGPGAARLERVLLFDGCDSEGSLLHFCGVVRVDNLFMGILDDKVAAPLALGSVDDILFATVGVHCGGEGVLLATDPTLTAVIDLASVTSGRDDVRALLELDVWRTGDETFNVERGESDKVVLVELIDVQDGVTNLLDVDGSTERGLLGVVSLEADTVLLVPDAVCGDRWVVAASMVRREAIFD